MGIVASLAAIPVAEDIIRDERRRELQRLEEERLRRLRESGYRYGDLDLQLIKRYEETSLKVSIYRGARKNCQN